MPSAQFFEALKGKLQTGNARTIHLNATPGKLATRLDLNSLAEIDPASPQEFLLELFSKEDFTFRISFENVDPDLQSVDKQKALMIIAKKLKAIISESDDNYKEQGIRTFSFGYPILVKRSNKNTKTVIKSPVFIWSLNIEKSPKAVNTWTLTRDPEQNTTILNPLLRTFLATDEDGLTMPQMSIDGPLSEDEIKSYCAELLTKCNHVKIDEASDKIDTSWTDGLQTVPDKNASDGRAENLSATILNAGVFGLFRSPRQEILNELEQVIKDKHQFEFENLKAEPFTGSHFSPVPTDPSQQYFINQLGESTNQIIQGPPGTGKSQSITAIIANALLNKKRCLVVCEKKTAMEVIVSNLNKLNPAIANLAALIEDVQSDRKAIVESIRNRSEKIDIYSSNYQPQLHEQVEKQSLNFTNIINAQHKELTKSVAGLAPWPSAVGKFLRLQKSTETEASLRLKQLLPSNLFEFKNGSEELESNRLIVQQGQELSKPLANLTTHPLMMLDQSLFSLNPISAKEQIDSVLFKAGQLLPAIQSKLDYLSVDPNANVENRNIEINHPAILAATTSYQDFYRGNQLHSQQSLPETLGVEAAIAAVKTKFAELQKDYEDIAIKSRKAISDHYVSVEVELHAAIRKFENDLNIAEEKFAKDLFNESFVLRLKLALFRGFSKRLQELLAARILVASNYNDVLDAFQKSGYFKHEIKTFAKGHAAEFRNSTLALKNILSDWSSDTPARINEHVENLSGDTLPKLLEGLGKEVNCLISAFDDLIKSFGPELKLDSELANVGHSIPGLQAAIPNIVSYANEAEAEVRIFKADYRRRAMAKQEVQALATELCSVWNNAACFHKLDNRTNTIDDVRSLVEDCQAQIENFKKGEKDFNDYFRWKHFYNSCTEQQKAVIDALLQSNISSDWDNAFSKWYWHGALKTADSYSLPDNDSSVNSLRKSLVLLSAHQQADIIYKWKIAQKEAVLNFPASNPITLLQLYNLRGSKGERRNSLKQIVSRDFKLFTSFFPVVMVSPDTASAILPLKEGLFDLVLFDEASQLRLEDTFTSLLRGKIKIIAGDKHQMPPSANFQSKSDAMLLDAPEDESFDGEASREGGPESLDDYRELNRNADLALADSESLLTYAEDSKYERSYLEIHYRSHHPALIEFSNSAFYGRRLTPMPAKADYIPISFHQVDGKYSKQTNADEGARVIDIIASIEKKSDGKYPSMMVATFNIYQRELIRAMIEERASNDPVFSQIISGIGENFDVKNLENIQGDEREIFIISTTFGLKGDGSKFSHNHGSVSQGKGHRMLNVLVTRAQTKLYVCTSIPANEIDRYATLLEQNGNIGNGALYAYLAYARAVSKGDAQAANLVLNKLFNHCADKPMNDVSVSEKSQGLSESVFEEEVYVRLKAAIGEDRIHQQYPVGGFRIDMVIKPIDPAGKMMAIECDGAKYHSSREAYAHDIFRQDQLEKQGFVFHRIWSSKWWRDEIGETEKLLQAIRANDKINAASVLPT